MSRKHPSKTENRVLKAFHQSSLNGGGVSKPRISELAGELGITAAAVANAKRRLKDRGLLSEAGDVTTAGFECLRPEVGSIQTEFSLSGEARAGQVKSDELIVNMVDRAEFMVPEQIHLPIPSSASQSNTVAFHVHGTGMEDQSIFDGDYVLVELYDDDGWPRAVSP